MEARWAFLFDGLGLAWEYEPFDAAGYIPDFVLFGDAALLVEVKPGQNLDDLGAATPKVSRALDGHWENDILIVGMSPILQQASYWEAIYHPVAGLLGESGRIDGWDGWSYGAGLWHTCGRCGKVGVFHEELWYRGRPCGHHDGDHYLGAAPNELIEKIWAEARNITRWQP